MEPRARADSSDPAQEMWGALARNAHAWLSDPDMRRFAADLGLTAPSPTPVPFPLDPTPGIIMDGTPVADSPAPTEAPVPPPAEIARDRRYQLRPAVLRIGRSPDNDVVVPDLTVSKHHAELRLRQAGITGALRGGGDPWLEITDLGSTNGTFLNDVRVRSGVVSSRSIITIGNSIFRMAGGELYEEPPGGISLTVRDLRRWVPTARASAGRALERTMADGISFSLAERSMLLVVGPLGSGKTALCDALTGQRIDDGQVRYNGRDLSEYADAFESRTGLVPQRPSDFNIGSPRPHPMGPLRSLARRTLQGRPTPRSVLANAAGQRFARDTSEAERDRQVGQVLVDATLAVHADVRLDRMLPHERKQVDIGLALLTDPAILFLDEPFAALDPGHARDMFAALRVMADPTSTAGRSVVVFVKDTDPVPVWLCDRLLVLSSGGSMAYFGPPVEGLRYFGREAWADVYQMFQDEPARDFAAEFRASPEYARYVTAPMSGSERGETERLTCLAAQGTGSAANDEDGSVGEDFVGGTGGDSGEDREVGIRASSPRQLRRRVPRLPIESPRQLAWEAV
jgi:ABC-type multidrug transport system ATPase subunit